MGKVGFGLAVSCAAATCAIAAILVGKRVRSRRKWRRVVGVLRDLEEVCETSVGRLRQVVDAMAVEMHAGLASEGGSKLKMLLTFVDKLPNGYPLVKLLVLLVGCFVFSVFLFFFYFFGLFFSGILMCDRIHFAYGSDFQICGDIRLINCQMLRHVCCYFWFLLMGFSCFWVVDQWGCRCMFILPIVSISGLWLGLFDSCFWGIWVWCRLNERAFPLSGFSLYLLSIRFVHLSIFFQFQHFVSIYVVFMQWMPFLSYFL